MARYLQRNAKYPIRLQAVKWEEGADLPEWCSAVMIEGATILAQTPDGPRRAMYGDYLVKGLVSELSESLNPGKVTIYVAAPEIFETRYQLDEESP